MRGIGYTLSRLPSARTLLAGAAIIAGALSSTAQGQVLSGLGSPDQVAGSGNGKGKGIQGTAPADEAAWVPTRLTTGGGSVLLPRPLRPSDAAIMRQVFALQARGNIPQAMRASGQLQDPLLAGTALADRFLGRYYKTTVSELTDWLSQYGDHPDAPAIHALLASKSPKGADLPPLPSNAALGRSGQPEPQPEDIQRFRTDLDRDAALDRAVLDKVQKGSAQAALRMIATRRNLPAAYAAQLSAEVAQVQFTRNDDAGALRIAQSAVRGLPADDQPALAWYVAGLAAWRMDQPDLALTQFDAAFRAGITTPHLQAASAFWASRAARRLQDAITTVRWLHRAADQPLTLHGFLARRLLRLPTGIMPSGEVLSQADAAAVAGTPQGRRALALLQIGQTDRAEAEFRLLWPQASTNAAFGRSLLMVVSAAGLTDCAAQMAGLLQAADGWRHDEMRFPLPKLRPNGGFQIDPALVYALTRLESNFDAAAVSPAGARGLMQLMPATAQYLMGERPLTAARLHEPATNLELGQRYVNHLAGLDGIEGDLIRMLASYNCGPGSFLRWSADVHDGGDPLLFMEAIPLTETRAFVPTALVYSWVYAARLHLPAPSLDSLAAGEFPRFTPLGQERRMAALN